MSIEDENLPAELRLKLQEIEDSAGPDYPDWKRGFKYGITTLIFGALVAPFVSLVLPDKLGSSWIYTIFAVFSIALLAFVGGAFRPASNKN